MKSLEEGAKALKIFIKRQPKKRIVLVVVLLFFLPVFIYGGSLGLRVYNLYSTMHESLDDEELPDYDPHLVEGDDVEVDDENGSDLSEEEREAIQIPEEDVEAYQFNDNQYYDLPRSERDPDLLHILLIGIDSEFVGGGGRSDTMMVVRFNERTEEAAILSIPRDTYIKIPGRGFDKAGHATAYGGISLLKETLENYLDIYIDYYVRVDMQSFEIGVNALGGLTIDVPHDIIHERRGLLFSAGTHHMDGEDILQYARQRRLVRGGGDFGRIDRQQQVVIEMLRTIRQDLTLYQTLDFMEEVARYFRTDLTPGAVASHWRAFNRIDLNEIPTVRLEGDSFMHNRIYYYRVSVKDAREQMEALAK